MLGMAEPGFEPRQPGDRAQPRNTVNETKSGQGISTNICKTQPGKD